jgi:hypothetical protein
MQTNKGDFRGEIMEAKSVLGRYRNKLIVILLFLAGFVFRLDACFAAEAGKGRGVNQVETTVIHVDQYAVYAPNVVFYFDPQMDKRKVASITKMAEQLRNKKAVITYSSAGDLSQDKHVVLVDILPVGGDKASPESAPRDQRNPAGDSQSKTSNTSATSETLPKDESGESGSQAARQDKKQAQTKAGASSPVTRGELTAFVRQILELNGKKDIAAIAPLYADKVDYYDRGVVGRDYVVRDLGYYFRNWEKITTQLEGDVVMIVLDQPEVRIAKFVSSFSVRNDKKSLVGKTENIWKVQKTNGKLMIIDVKQKLLGKESAGQ